MGDGDFFFGGELGHFHAEGLPQLVLRRGEDGLELPAAVGGEHWVGGVRSFSGVCGFVGGGEGGEDVGMGMGGRL